MSGSARLSVLVGLAMTVATGGCAPLAIGGAAAGAAVAVSEERGIGGFISDAEIQAQINALWAQHSLDLLNSIDMTVDQGRVLLTGKAKDAQMRLDAVRLSWQARGVKEVINEIQVDTASGIMDSARDVWISTQIRGRLTFDTGISSQNYSVDTVNGIVYLMGVAKSREEMQRAVDHARSVPDVQRVVNYVRVL